jgi:hypothetical protein
LDRHTEILIVLGQQYLQGRERLAKNIAELENSLPDWTAVQIVTCANQHTVQEQTRDSLQVDPVNAPGVIAMNQGISGRLTQGDRQNFGSMSRNHPTNAVAATGNKQDGYTKLNAE